MPPDNIYSFINQQVEKSENEIENLLQKTPALWRGSASRLARENLEKGLPSGYPALDSILPWGGWPCRGIVEIVSTQEHIGELRLLMPLLRSLSQQQRASLWITPPYAPYAPALLQAGIAVEHIYFVKAGISWRQSLWSMEKALQSPDCALVLAWLQQLTIPVLRRLQLAANTGGTLGVVFHQRQLPNSPSVLRLAVKALASSAEHPPGTLAVRIMKARGCHKRPACVIPAYRRPS